MPASKSEYSATHPNAPTVRVDARVPLHIKNNLAMAAALSGRTQTDFLITAVNEAAQKVIAEHNVISLCLEDQRALAKALMNENAPPDEGRWDRLREAMRRHAAEVDSRHNDTPPGISFVRTGKTRPFPLQLRR